MGNTIKEDKYLDPNDIYNSRKALNQGLWECASDLNSRDFPSRCVWGLNSTQSCMHRSRWVLDLPGTNKLLFSSVMYFLYFMYSYSWVILLMCCVVCSVQLLHLCLTLCNPMDCSGESSLLGRLIRRPGFNP